MSIAIGALLIALSVAVLMVKRQNYHVSYWLWAGITADNAPSDAELYVYQGLITSHDRRMNYRRIGLYPHPIKCTKLFLVYRLEGSLPDPKKLVSIFEDSASQWQRHNIEPVGVQLDFDSPTSKLLIYSNFLKNVRKLLPAKYALSITGLGDWAVYGNINVMKSIAHTTNEIVFQLYQGWLPLPNTPDYIRTLSKYPLKFRVGFLSRYPNENYIAILKQNRKFNGVIYFIQKAH